MSEKNTHAKLLQVIQNFFTKTSLIILQCRSLPDPLLTSLGAGAKTNKWFNLNLTPPQDDWVRDEMKLWKSFHDVSHIQPMIIESYLDLRQLGPREIVSLEDDTGNSWTVAKGSSKKQEIVVERWLIEFDRSAVSSLSADELPLIYKQAIVLLRVIYGFTRLLPAYKLRKILGQVSSRGLLLRNKFIDGRHPISSKGRVGLSKSIIPHQMLLTDSHLTQKSFAPVHTTLGALRVSVAYRNHYRFTVQDNEEMLSNQFLNSDKDTVAAHLGQMRVSSTPPSLPQESIKESSHKPAVSPSPTDPVSLLQAAKQPVLPCSSVQPEENKRDTKQKLVLYAPTTSIQRPSIQPFKAGSMSNSPPSTLAAHGPGAASAGSTLERRISITSNRSGSNASLAALLRNPRGSMSSSHTPAVAISTSQGTSAGTSAFPRSISSSHGSHHVSEDIGENPSSTPRFSSSFGSRQSRRLSNTSVRHSSLTNEAHAPSLYGASVDSGGSKTPASGLYLDDDIGQFVRMIDCKSDLWLSGGQGSKSLTHTDSNTQWDALSRFQFLKSQHDHLGDSVNASVVFNQSQASPAFAGDSSRSGGSSRPSSTRSSSHAVNSASPSAHVGSLDKQFPSIGSRLLEKHEDNPVESTSRSLIVRPRRRSSSSGRNKEEDSSTRLSPGFFSSSKKTGDEGHEEVTGLATTPSIYAAAKRPIKYEGVFEDDEECSDYYGPQKMEHETSSTRANDSSYDNDELLFEMTDTR